jgi:hypothetical protein
MSNTLAKAMSHTMVEILNQEIDTEGKMASYYRMLVDKEHFKYITIDSGVYEADDLCFPQVTGTMAVSREQWKIQRRSSQRPPGKRSVQLILYGIKILRLPVF